MEKSRSAEGQIALAVKREEEGIPMAEAIQTDGRRLRRELRWPCDDCLNALVPVDGVSCSLGLSGQVRLSNPHKPLLLAKTR